MKDIDKLVLRIRQLEENLETLLFTGVTALITSGALAACLPGLLRLASQ